MKERINIEQDCNSRDKELVKIKEDTKALMDLVRKVNVFGNNQKDEFQVVRENGNTQGIFKSWAVPIIPFIETDTLTLLRKDLNKREGAFWDKLSENSSDIIEIWHNRLIDNPFRLMQSLERWRGFSETWDERLHCVFNQRELPTDKDEKIAELFLRLQVAFAFSAPFYHLEAMAGDIENTRFNPISSSEKNKNKDGGELDLIALVLPSVFKDKIITSETQWNGLSWDRIRKLTKKLDENQKIVALRISKVAGVDIEDVLFAANVLQWIPASVGGKKDDLSKEAAASIALEILNGNTELTNGKVARDVNALIRFLNWFPLIKRPDNFNGKAWRYAAVCDTAQQLLEEVSQENVFEKGFEEIFKNILLPQVQQLDAASAKGRFLLNLLNEGLVNKKIQQIIINKRDQFIHEISKKSLDLKHQTSILDIHEAKPRHLVGGKAAGLREAALVFGKEKVLKGKVLSSEIVSDWLKTDSVLWQKIITLDYLDDINQKLYLANEIRNKIMHLDTKSLPIKRIASLISNIPGNHIMVRSSSFDEDHDLVVAPGIYESVGPRTKEDFEVAIQEVVLSFFSEKAVSFRNLTGFSNIPMFAIILSQHITGTGGAIFTRGNGKDWEMTVASDPKLAVQLSGEDFDTFEMSSGVLTSTINQGFLDERSACKIGDAAVEAERVFNKPQDIEFVVESNSGETILQRRSLPQKTQEESSMQTDAIDTEIAIEALSDLPNLKIEKSKNIRLILGSNINTDQFQGELFRWLTKNKGLIKEIVLSSKVPRTSHFANICNNLDIKLCSKYQ